MSGSGRRGDALDDLDAARHAVLDVCRRMAAERLVLGSAGNVSVRLKGSWFLATPSGVPYDRMEAGDLPVVDAVSGEWEGRRKPTSEVPLHTGILAERHDVGAIVHTHSRYAAALSVARIEVPFICNESLGMHAERILVTRYAPPGTERMAESALETFAQQPGSRAVLLANHGVVAIADDLDAAYLVAAQVEWVAEIYYLARTLGGGHVIARDDQLTMARTYGIPLGAGPNKEEPAT